MSRRIRRRFVEGLMLCAASLVSAAAFAYGGGGGGSSDCTEPSFYQESPAKDAIVSSLSEISFVASDNTEIDTLVLQINGEKIQPTTHLLRSGAWEIKAVLPKPIVIEGKVRIAVRAKSKDGCERFYPYYLSIKP